MAIAKPYYRIYRPGLGRDTIYNSTNGFERDGLFIEKEEKQSLKMAARLIIDDFKRLLEYIEPDKRNENVFSHRIYELLLRTCTEVESNCKGILKANNYRAVNRYGKDKKDYDMNDYKKVEQSSHLSSYVVYYSNWLPDKYTSKPFAAWAENDSLPWYDAYNKVKHHRSQFFSLANLKNLLDAICGLLCIIHSEIGEDVQLIYDSNLYVSTSEPSVFVGEFEIIPSLFSDREKYDFVWEDLKSDPYRFQSFPYE